MGVDDGWKRQGVRPDVLRPRATPAGFGDYCAAIASRTTAESSSGLSIGGRQVKLVHTTATDLFSFSAGKFGIVSASTAGRFSATASLSVKCTTDKLTA